MLIQIKNGTIFFGANDVFENIDFQINENERIALIGRNGSGKTTLLNVISGELELQSGNIFRNNKIEISFLKQNALASSNNNLYDEMLEVFKDLILLEKELENKASELEESHDEKNIAIYSKLLDDYKNLGGYNYQNEIKTVLHGFGFKDADLNKNINDFSGGEKTKIAFAKLLLKKPDLLLLDEPTNHLDLNTIEWLESYLNKYNKAMIIVSHDRIFIDKLATSVYELEYGNIKKYHGNYSSFVEQKKNDYLKQETAYKRQQKDIKRLEEQIEKFRYKKDKAAFAQSKIKYLDKMDKIDNPRKADTKSFKARFICANRGGKNVLSLDHYQVGYDKVLCEINLNINRGERICILGDNGTGKSTLLKSIVGEIKELGGYKMFGHQIDVGYFDQNLANFKSNNTVLEELYRDNNHLTMLEARNVLGSFLFTSDEVFKEVNVLSGGEKVRLSLAKLMLKKANFLILDEPTNHLDIVSKEALEEALIDYDGTILFVSHDRYFIKKIATSCIVINNNETKYYADGYMDYIDIENKKRIKDKETKVKQEEKPLKEIKKRPKYNIKKLEEEISQLEILLEEKRELRYEPEYYQDSKKMQELDEEIDDIHNKIAHVTEKWEDAMKENDS